MLNLSIILIAKNEGHCIRRCLESVKWASEIIVYDNGSQDETLRICEEYKAQIFKTDDWPGYGVQKNRALSKATQAWVLSLDADEYLSEALQKEIQSTLTDTRDFSAFEIPFINYFQGKAIRFGDWGQHKVLRLFKRKEGQISENTVHEGIKSKGKIGLLKNPIYHESYENLAVALEKMNHYTSLTASLRLNQGKHSSVLKALISSSWVFFRNYFLRLGLLDGQAGFLLAVYLSENSFYRHVKMLKETWNPEKSHAEKL